MTDGAVTVVYDLFVLGLFLKIFLSFPCKNLDKKLSLSLSS